jgi:hypothetical protein
MLLIRRIPTLALVAAGILTAANGPVLNSAHAQDRPNVHSNVPSDVSIPEARQAIEQGETSWARARVSIDKDAFEKALAPDFYAQLPDRRLTRAEFITRISNYPPGVTLTRFDNRVLTVQQEGDKWVAIILEKLEYERRDEGGKKVTEYAQWVTRDGWKKFGNEWKALFSEAVGVERWKNGERPPMKDW